MDCRAPQRATGYGAGRFDSPGSVVEFIDCHILWCHASNINGGIAVANSALLVMIRSTIIGCSSSSYGGALQVFAGGRANLSDVLIAECQTTGDQEHGGGIYMQDGTLTMTGSTIRDCKALKGGNNGGGGALAVKAAGAQVQLSGVTIQGCKSPLRVSAGSVRLVDVSFTEAASRIYAEIFIEGGRIDAERVRVVSSRFSVINSAVAIETGVTTWTDCTFSDYSGTTLVASGGTHTFTRTTILRSGRALWTGGVTTMLDSRIADCRVCIQAGGMMSLRNTKLSNCSTRYIRFETRADGASHATTFQSELLTLEPSCEADQGAALIRVDGTVAAPLKVRGLQVITPAACATKTFSVFSNNNGRLLNCSDGDDVCGAAATCADMQPLPSVPNLTTVNCSCLGEVFPNPKGTSLALAPYGFDASSLGLPVGLDPTTVGLPGTIIDYCVRSDTDLEPAHKSTGGLSARMGTPCHAGHATRTNAAQPQCPSTASWSDPSLQDRISQCRAHLRAHDPHKWHRRRSCKMGGQWVLCATLAVASNPGGKHRRDGAVGQPLAESQHRWAG